MILLLLEIYVTSELLFITPLNINPLKRYRKTISLYFLVYLLLQLLFDGDILLPTPSWVSYAPQALLGRNKVYWVETTSENNWFPTVKEIEKIILKNKDKNYLLFLNSPNNPSGQICNNLKEISFIAKKYNIHVVEDACMGIGSRINKKSPGTFGIVNAFSMHPLKSLNVMGDGGMVVTNNKKIAEWLRKFRNHGMVDRDHIDFWGVNMRLQPLQAVVALEGLKTVRSVIKKRNINARQMDMGLKDLYPKVILPKRLKNYHETFALYMALFEKRDQLLKYLIKNKIEAKIHYPIPLHLQKAARKLGYKKGDFKVAENQAKKLITLPIHQFIKVKQIKYVIKIITRFYSLN